ncbi:MULTISPECIES: hypothetical protein [Roseomonadaceae]|uniref:Uncharacterized protein n=1 Tax=Falsiroseomonas oleicola TaxID=2801474 RepID=A0ABS6HA36_9PROT|nr:hypothetical protein [Roseomonas oleicola]MBU8544195.1 hypothetical protein [Roseomonas oleicola]
MFLKWRSAAVVVTLGLAVAAAASTFVKGTPRQAFLTDCIARSYYPERWEAVERCKEELAELRLDRTVGTVVAGVGTLILIPTITVNVMVILVWVSLLTRRR